MKFEKYFQKLFNIKMSFETEPLGYMTDDVRFQVLTWVLQAEAGSLSKDESRAEELLRTGDSENGWVIELLGNAGAFDAVTLDEEAKAELQSLPPRLLGTLLLSKVYNATSAETAKALEITASGVDQRKAHLREYPHVARIFFGVSPVEILPEHLERLIEIDTEFMSRDDVYQAAATIFEYPDTIAGFRLLHPNERRQIVYLLAGISDGNEAEDSVAQLQIAGKAFDSLILNTIGIPDSLPEGIGASDLVTYASELFDDARYAEFAEQLEANQRLAFETFVNSDSSQTFAQIERTLGLKPTYAARYCRMAMEKLNRLYRGEYAGVGKLPIQTALRAMLSDVRSYDEMRELFDEERRIWLIASAGGLSFPEVERDFGLGLNNDKARDYTRRSPATITRALSPKPKAARPRAYDRLRSTQYRMEFEERTRSKLIELVELSDGEELLRMSPRLSVSTNLLIRNVIDRKNNFERVSYAGSSLKMAGIDTLKRAVHEITIAVEDPQSVVPTVALSDELCAYALCRGYELLSNQGRIAVKTKLSAIESIVLARALARLPIDTRSLSGALGMSDSRTVYVRRQAVSVVRNWVAEDRDSRVII